MKGCSKAFEDVIMAYLKRFAERDETFKKKLENEKKSISECCDFIASEVNRMGVCGLTDAEVFGLAVHYYDEEDVKIELNNMQYHAVANQPIELTDDEKAEAKKKALEDYQRQMYNEYLSKNKKKETTKKETLEAVQLSLFD